MLITNAVATTQRLVSYYMNFDQMLARWSSLRLADHTHIIGTGRTVSDLDRRSVCLPSSFDSFPNPGTEFR